MQIAFVYTTEGIAITDLGIWDTIGPFSAYLPVSDYTRILQLAMARGKRST
jgi:hypothetical protein